MKKIYEGIDYSDFEITSPFGVIREYGFHEGTDFISGIEPRKTTLIKNILRSKVTSVTLANTYGNKVIVATNLNDLSIAYPKFPKLNETIYIDYCHLHKVSVQVGQNLESGDTVGFMGNTGHSLKCIDFKKDVWIPITKAEQEDPLFDLGVHLHLNIRQSNKSTNFVKYLKYVGLYTASKVKNQWTDVLFSHDIFIAFLESLETLV